MRRARYAASGSRRRPRPRRGDSRDRRARRGIRAARPTAAACGIRASPSLRPRAPRHRCRRPRARARYRDCRPTARAPGGGCRACRAAHRPPRPVSRNRPRRRWRGLPPRRATAQCRRRSPRRHSAPCRWRAAARAAIWRRSSATTTRIGLTRGRSAAVKTRPRASGGTEIDLIRAWACGLRTNATSIVPGNLMSATNWPRPCRCRSSSLRSSDAPTPNRSSGIGRLPPQFLVPPRRSQ